MRPVIFLICLVAAVTTADVPRPARAADLPATATTLDLLRAAAAGDQVLLTQRWLAGADPNVVGTDWRGGLHHAVLLGRLDMVTVLVRAGARIDWQDVDKVTPLILAAHGNYPEIAEYLILAGADPLIADRRGRRALDYALMRGKNDPGAPRLRRAEINRTTHKNK